MKLVLRKGLIAASLLTLAALGRPSEARAWDPSTTHQALVDQAVKQSNWHLRWMDASQMQRTLPCAIPSQTRLR